MADKPHNREPENDNIRRFLQSPNFQEVFEDMAGINEEHNLETYLRILFNAVLQREITLPEDEKVGKFVTLNGKPLAEATEAEIRKLHSHPNIENLRLARKRGLISVNFYFQFPTKDRKVIGTVDLADMLRCAPRFGPKSGRMIKPLSGESPEFRKWKKCG